jgi:putative ABC transport system permease protein
MRLFEFDTLTEILTTMRENKLRTFLTGFAVAWGIFMLIILLGSGNGLKNGVTSNFSDRSTNTMEVWPGRTTMPYKGFKAYRQLKFTNNELELLQHRFPQINHISGQIRRSSTLTFGKESSACDIQGVAPDYQFIGNITFTSGNGRFFNDEDVKQDRKVIVISKKVAQDIFDKGANPLGQWIKLDGMPFQIVGIDTKTSFNNMGYAYIPFRTAQKLYQMGNETRSIQFSVQGLDTKDENDAFGETVRQTLGRELLVHPDDLNAIGLWNQASDYVQTMTIFSTIDLFIFFIGICTLIAGIVGVANIMVITVKERTKEFGIRKALGATPGTILNAILLESIVITSLFGYLGMMLGIALLQLISKGMSASADTPADGERSVQVFQDPSVDISIVLAATAILILAGLLAGYLPARKAVKIKPIEAMRAE